MRVGDRIKVIQKNTWVDTGVIGKITEVDKEGCRFTHPQGVNWLHFERFKLLTFKEYLRLL